MGALKLGGALQQAKQMAEDLREWVKALGFGRHKLIIQARQSFYCPDVLQVNANS